MTVHGQRPPSSTPTRPRSLAPDLARGFMLLLIGLAYGAVYLEASATVLAPVAEGGADRVTNFLRTVFVHERSYTMFTALFGYGLVMIIRKLQRQEMPAVAIRKLLRRRGWLLLLFGFIHGALVFSGEILGTYGLASVLLAGLVLREDRRLKRVMVAFLAVQATLIALLWTGAYAGGALTEFTDAGTTGQVNYLPSVLERALEYPFSPPFILVMYPVIPVLLIGVWAGRKRLLEDAVTHRRLLVRTAWIGTTVSIVCAAPLGAINAGWVGLEPLPTGVLVAVHNLSGIAGGLGYLAIFALIGHRLQGRQGLVASALAATGQRSLTAYLTMSVLIAVAFAPWGLGLGVTISVTAAALASFACWVLALLLCVGLARAGRAGPADALLRRMLYRTDRGQADAGARGLTAPPDRS